jgi:hypothetical protein
LTEDLLKLEVRLLLLRHGRKKVVQTLAALGEQTPEQVENELRAAEERKPTKKRKVLSASEAVANAARQRPDAAELLQLLATRYENRTFLPQLKDAQRFLDRSGTPGKKLKSRNEAGHNVITALCRLSVEELRQLAARSVSSKGDSDYVLLAREIVGKTGNKQDSGKATTEDLNKTFKVTFTAVREGGGSDVTGVQTLVECGDERWRSRLYSPGEFAELMLASRIFPPEEADNLFRRVREQGQIIERNVALTEKQIHFLGLRHAD